MTKQAAGSFEVKTSPLATDDSLAGTAIGRFALEKTFHGDLDATSKGMMLTAGNLAKGVAGYVAIEQVTGSLDGRSGSFALQHNGTMGGGTFELSVNVVPGSGSGALEGISGELKIVIEGGKHAYTFAYELPASA